jgi:hypothetical protein
MAKLKCSDHLRRVLLLASSSVVHREDGTLCDSPVLWLGDEILSRSGHRWQTRPLVTHPDAEAISDA